MYMYMYIVMYSKYIYIYIYMYIIKVLVYTHMDLIARRVERKVASFRGYSQPALRGELSFAPPEDPFDSLAQSNFRANQAFQICMLSEIPTP